MQPRIIINLQENEYRALMNISEREFRPMRLQAELIFRDALIERGIIKVSKIQPSRQAAKKSKRNDLSTTQTLQPN